jgi:serine/threonine protein kinase
MNVSGDVIDGRFELIERLGSGGMGTVWRARDIVLQREVALKAVRPEAETSPGMRERVLREAQALARLSNPHVVTIHQTIDTGQDAHPWLVMELVPGVSLQQRLQDGPLAPREAARLGRQMLSALRAAHAAGIQHRDVKPANVLIRPDGTAVLTDFGIAALQGTTALTVTGELVGSPEYMAPERVRGNGDRPASDLWSLGLVLYVSTEGVSPMRRGTTLATLAAVLDDPVPPPVRSGPLAPVLEALLVRDPAARPDAEALDAMLARVESGQIPDWTQPTATAPQVPAPTVPDVVPPAPGAHAGPSSRPDPGTPPTTPAPAPARRSRAPLAVAALAAVAVGAVTALVVTLTLKGDGSGDDRAGGGTGSSATTPSPTPKKSGSPGKNTDKTTDTTTEKNDGKSPSPSPSTPPGVADGWIAQLYSEPVGSGTAARDQRLVKIRESVPEAVYLRSDDYASLRPGYWVIYAPGPFADGREALTFCAERGRTAASACIGRYVSGSSADYALQCRPPAAAPTGRCTRT